MKHFDYAQPSELFCAMSVSRKSRVTYKRFDSAAEAIRFVMEELAAQAVRAATIEVEDGRLDGAHISALYHHPDYPLARKVSA